MTYTVSLEHHGETVRTADYYDAPDALTAGVSMVYDAYAEDGATRRRREDPDMEFTLGMLSGIRSLWRGDTDVCVRDPHNGVTLRVLCHHH